MYTYKIIYIYADMKLLLLKYETFNDTLTYFDPNLQLELQMLLKLIIACMYNH